MMEHLNFERWDIGFNFKKTIEAYKRIDRGISDKCRCSSCILFQKFKNGIFPPDFSYLLSYLGIDYQKEAEIFSEFDAANQLVLFKGFYHFHGKIISMAGDTDVNRNGRYYPLKDGTLISFSGACEMLEDVFEKPHTLQLNFIVRFRGI